MARNQRSFVVGYGVEDITPPVGEFCSFRLAPNKRSLGVHDKISANVLYLDNGENALLMISVDTVILPESVVDRIKKEVSGVTGMSTEQILVASTHTHNGAELAGEEPLIDNSVQVERVLAASTKAAASAINGKISAKLGWGHFTLPGLAKNRFQNRLSEGDVNKVDDRLDFLKIEDENGVHKGILWHFAAHPTACMRAGYLISADYYGVANKLTVEELGGFSMFFNGACGNINPELGKRTFERAEYYGKWIADKLIEEVPHTKTACEGCLNSVQTTVEVPLTSKREKMTLFDDRDEIMDYFREIESREIPFTLEAYDENVALFQQLRTSWWRHKLVEDFGNIKTEKICIQAYKILDHLIVTIPGEIFIEFQIDLQKKFKNNRAMIFGYANGYCGYIPDSKSYDTDTYETNPTIMHRAGQHAGEKMMLAGEKLLNELH